MHGHGVSPGISIGIVEIHKDFNEKIEKREVLDTKHEVKKYLQALRVCRHNVEETYRQLYNEVGEEEAELFHTHMELLDDEEIIEQVKREITGRQINAEFALKNVMDNYISIFESFDDEEMNEKVNDLKEILLRLLKIMISFSDQKEKMCGLQKVIITKNLKTTDTTKIDLNCVIGIVSETGGETSHSAIMAKALGVPAVVGLEGILRKVKDGDEIIIDGFKGRVILKPSEKQKQIYMEKKKIQMGRLKKLEEYRNKQTITKDGHLIELSSNIATLRDIPRVFNSGSEGIGLFRTEFIYMNREELPSEETQFNIYKRVAYSMKGKPVVVRTLDIGGDKELEYLQFPKEENPFLGYRAIRISLDRVDIFKTQLRAILRASIYGELKIMFPLISHYNELMVAKNILNYVKKELDKEGVRYNKDIEVGMMVEVPSAVLIADFLAKEVDFFSIGTNDLIQYTVAVDRTNDHLDHLYTAYHPAVLKLIKMTIDSAHKNDIWVGICGEAAGNESLIPLLVSMGIDEFSMNSNEVLRSRYVINHISKEEYSKHIDEILSLQSCADVKERLLELNEEYGCHYKIFE
jgi:phosphotransferase system enzyme I (PtsI)